MDADGEIALGARKFALRPYGDPPRRHGRPQSTGTVTLIQGSPPSRQSRHHVALKSSHRCSRYIKVVGSPRPMSA
jgi:hypothetical protein